MKYRRWLLFSGIAWSLLGASAWAQNIQAGPATGLRIAPPFSVWQNIRSIAPAVELTPRQKQMLSGPASSFLYGPWRGKADEFAANPLLARSKAVSIEPAAAGLKRLPTVNDRHNDLSPTFGATQSETSVAVNGNTVLVGFNTSAYIFGSGSFSGWSISTNGGTAFSEVTGGLPDLSSGSDTLVPAGDPSLAVDGLGNFYYASLVEDVNSGQSWVIVYESQNGGHTFGPVFSVTDGNVHDFLDKELLAIDPVNERAYLTFTQFLQGGGDNLLVVSFAAAGTSGSTHIVALSNAEGSGTMPAVGPGGVAYVAFEQFTGGDTAAIMFTKSTDGGATWSTPSTIAGFNIPADLGASASCGRVALAGDIRSNEFPSIAVDTGSKKMSGNVYVVWNALAGSTADILFSRSTDGGSSWSTPKTVNKNTAGDQFMPWVSANSKTGSLAVLYYDRSTDANNWHINVNKATSGNGGGTFANSALESFQFPVIVNTDPVIALCYMGDYNQVTNNGKNFLYAWGDNSNGEPDVFFKKK